MSGLQKLLDEFAAEFAQMSKAELEEELRALGIDPGNEAERARPAIERAITEAKQ